MFHISLNLTYDTINAKNNRHYVNLSMFVGIHFYFVGDKRSTKMYYNVIGKCIIGILEALTRA